MSDEKPKPGRPRKWSSDAERMHAHRAAKRDKQRADAERRAAAEREAAEKAKSPRSPAPGPEASATNLTAEEGSAVHGSCEAIIEPESTDRLSGGGCGGGGPRVGCGRVRGGVLGRAR